MQEAQALCHNTYQSVTCQQSNRAKSYHLLVPSKDNDAKDMANQTYKSTENKNKTIVY
jgi:hypothetical protein